MAQLFSRSKVPQLEKLMSNHIDRFIVNIRSDGSAVDLVMACRALEADIMSEFSFGRPIQALNAWSNGKKLAMVASNDEKATWMPVLATFPPGCALWEQVEDVLFRVTGMRTQYTKGLADFQTWCQEHWQAVISATASHHGKSASAFPNLIQTLCNTGLLSETALAEARENLGPGTDTTSATLAHILWALAYNPGYQAALYKDLDATDFSTNMTTLESIPRLQACVKEGIRWAGAAAAMLPRMVPTGGVKLHDKYIPEGTVLTSSPIWYLHDATAYPNPRLYDPYRWLTSDGQSISEDRLRDRFYIPFSRGANICLGAHFSYLELYVSVSQIVRKFHLEPCEGTQNSEYQQVQRKWHPVLLPERKEWVAAVPVTKLKVIMRPRPTH